MPKTFALVSGMLLLIFALLELLFFRGNGTSALLTFSATHNLIHWLLGAVGLLASWSQSRASVVYAKLAGVFLTVFAFSGFFFSAFISNRFGIELNWVYNVWHLALGMWGIAAGFRNVRAT